MIESIMFFGGGFLAAGLFALILISFVHHRAVRLTERRLEGAIPVSLAEIQAEKDLLRADFAVTARRLEMSVEQLKAKSTSQLSDIAHKSEAINRLKAELSAKIAAADELDATARLLGSKLHDLEQEHAAATLALETVGRTLAERDSDLANALHQLDEHKVEGETQRVEIALLKSQVEQFQSRIDELQTDAANAARRLFDERVAASAANKDLEEKRQVIETLRPRVAQLEDELAKRVQQGEEQARHAGGLDQRRAELQRQLDDRDAEISSLREELATIKHQHDAVMRRLQEDKGVLERRLRTTTMALAAHAERISQFESQTEERERRFAELDVEMKALRQDAGAEAQRWRAEKKDLQGQLQHALRVRGEAQVELTALKTEAEATRKAERGENALLRERIIDIAAQVAQMAGSAPATAPIEAVRIEAGSVSVRGPTSDEPLPRTENLTERIRSLQARASRPA